MKLSKATINQMSMTELRTTLSKVEFERCQAWKKYYKLLKELEALKKLHTPSEGETDNASTNDESESEEDSDDDEPLSNLLSRPAVPPPTPTTLQTDKNGKPKKWCEVCQKHISRDNFATHVKTTKKHQT
jgi:hypothetical protein